jgi:prefoldin subunit 4
MAKVEVLAADQERINKFGNLNTQSNTLKLELTDIEKKKAQFEAAADDLELAEAEGIIDAAPYQIGIAFLEFPVDLATEQVRADAAEFESKAAELKAKIDAKEAEMDVLRTTLYAKFGRDNINLG